jgi:hypothetical protein
MTAAVYEYLEYGVVRFNYIYIPMKKVIPAIFLLSFIASSFNRSDFKPGRLASGSQPQISLSKQGTVEVVFGRNDSIFYSRGTKKGLNFSTPIFIAHVPKMHLGMSRGPQIARSSHNTLITAMDQAGNIHWWLLNPITAKFVKKGLVNDIPSIAPEGLMGIASDDKDDFYAVWLDLRVNQHNNICFSSLSAGDDQWSPNKIIYQSPEGHTCECCKPNIAVRDNHVAVMFRNWISGSRDMYLMESFNSGKTFSKAQKLGNGTWKLNGCPMDGGGLTIDDRNQVLTAWQREGVVYYCKPGYREIMIDKGRICSIYSVGSETICSYQQGDSIKYKYLMTSGETTVGSGSFPKAAILPDKSVVCFWEHDSQIFFSRL